MKKFNYDKAEADLYESGCHYSEEIYGYKSERGINEFMKENGLNPEKYYEEDKSGNQPKGSENGNGISGCFLTSACVESKGLPDDCAELETLRTFRDNYLSSIPNGKNEIAHYYEIAPVIVNNINSESNPKDIWKQVYYELVVPSVDLIKSGFYEKAYAHYKNYTLLLEKKYKSNIFENGRKEELQR